MARILIVFMLALCTQVSGEVVEPEVASSACLEADGCEVEEAALVAVELADPVRAVARPGFLERAATSSHHEHELLRPPEA